VAATSSSSYLAVFNSPKAILAGVTYFSISFLIGSWIEILVSRRRDNNDASLIISIANVCSHLILVLAYLNALTFTSSSVAATLVAPFLAAWFVILTFQLLRMPLRLGSKIMLDTNEKQLYIRRASSALILSFATALPIAAASWLSGLSISTHLPASISVPVGSSLIYIALTAGYCAVVLHPQWKKLGAILHSRRAIITLAAALASTLLALGTQPYLLFAAGSIFSMIGVLTTSLGIYQEASGLGNFDIST